MSDPHVPFTVYSKSGCTFCNRLVDFMESKDIPYTKLMLGEDYTVEDFTSRFGTETTFPRVLLQDQLIGGMKDTVKFLLEHDYV